MLNLFFKFRFILVLACLKNHKRHDAKFCSVKCFERVHVLQMSPVHVLQMSPVHVLQMSPVHVLQMSPVHVLQMSPVHVLQMSPVHVLQMSPVHVLQMSPVHVLQMSPVHVLQMSPVQVLQNESSPGFTSPVQSMFYNMPICSRDAKRKQEFSNVIGWPKRSLLRQPITLPDSCFRFASREQIRLVENGLYTVNLSGGHATTVLLMCK